MIKKFKKKYSGMTLVEVIITLVLIIILIIIFLAYFRSQILKSQDAKRKADINRIRVAIEEYEKDHNCYPEPQLVICDPGTGLSPYINKIPCDPVTNASYFYEYDTNVACSRWFRVYANLESNDPDIVAFCGPGASFNYFQGSSNAPPCQYSDTGNFYGCRSGLCVPIYWDNLRPGPECDPNWQRIDCYGQCSAQTECKSWQQ